jgi:phytanoyl-CoA hydroxylase
VRAHPWSPSFTWTTRAGPRRRLTEDQARRFDTDGYVLVEGALDPGRLALLTAALDAEEERTTAWLRDQPEGEFFIASAEAITFTVHLVARVDQARAFATNAVFAELCADLVGDDVRLYWDQAVYKKPEPRRQFPWHQDNGYTFVEPQQYLTCWVPLTEATLANGCPWVVPGLHRWGTLAHEATPSGLQCLTDPVGAVAVEAQVGDVVVFSSLTPHRTGPNLTDRVRKAYILQFAPDGAVARQGDPPAPPTGLVRQDDPKRQFPILQHGRPVENADTAT